MKYESEFQQNFIHPGAMSENQFIFKGNYFYHIETSFYIL